MRSGWITTWKSRAGIGEEREFIVTLENLHRFFGFKVDLHCALHVIM